MPDPHSIWLSTPAINEQVKPCFQWCRRLGASGADWATVDPAILPLTVGGGSRSHRKLLIAHPSLTSVFYWKPETPAKSQLCTSIPTVAEFLDK